ncbi:MAG: CPBP family intramembrane metalloprotease [Verrucomicrobiota bacterium]|nr:CPBP family intramembrane metalloprotease [Verrucomicrobiota bacterium]
MLGLLGVISLLLLFLAKKRGFFSLPSSSNWFFPLRWYHLLILFGIYFTSQFLAMPLAALLIKKRGLSLISVEGFGTVTFISSLITLFLLYSYFFSLPKKIKSNIWQARSPSDPWGDLKCAGFAWLIGFPLVVFCNELLELLLQTAFHLTVLPEQIAVRFVKMTFDIPLQFFFSTVTIAFIAPLIEELLFRGFLQSFIRQHYSVNTSIVVTALLFASFHYSPQQGVANFSILFSLFIFALFLGYIYDRRQSLLAPIALHTLFNGCNIFNLYFFGDLK